MIEQKSSPSGMWVFALIFLIGAISFFGAWFLVEHPGMWGTAGNRGSLIQPAVPIDHGVFHPIDVRLSSSHPLKEIRGRWVIIHVLLDEDRQSCRRILADTRRLHPLFSKDIPRVRRLAVWRADRPPEEDFLQWLSQDRDLYLAQVDREFLAELSETILKSPLHCGQVVLMDPLGNLMMWYDAGFDPYDLYHDLKRLLKASQIG